MKALNLAQQERAVLPVVMPDGTERRIQRRKVTVTEYRAYLEKVDELNAQHREKKIDDAEFGVAMVLHVAEGIEKKDLDGLDMAHLVALASAVQELLTAETPEQKKTALAGGITPASSAES